MYYKKVSLFPIPTGNHTICIPLTRFLTIYIPLFFVLKSSVWREKKSREDSNTRTKLEEYKDSVVDVKEM